LRSAAVIKKHISMRYEVCHQSVSCAGSRDGEPTQLQTEDCCWQWRRMDWNSRKATSALHHWLFTNVCLGVTAVSTPGGIKGAGCTQL